MCREFLTQTFKMVRFCRLLRALLLRIQQYGILILWILLISIIFCSSYSKYMPDPRYFYLREIIGYGLLISRAMASVVNISSFLVIIPMSRSFTTYLRVLTSKISVKYVRHCIDASRTFHVICAFTILTAGCLHSIAHVINAFNFCTQYNILYKDINVAKFKGEDPLNIIFGTVPGITGILMIIILLTLAATAVQYVRSINYEVFWLCHHLFLVFYALLLLHPTSGLLKEQINITEHVPGCVMNTSESNIKGDILLCEKDPIFITQTSETWKWLAAGLAIYTVDMGFRLFRRRNYVRLLNFQVYKCNVLYLKLLKENFEAKPGQYIYLQCPKTSRLEWHPFSISKCPSSHDPSFTIHLRINGDWSALVKTHLINEAKEIRESPCQSNYKDFCSRVCKRFLIDGPYSSCFEDVLRYSVNICIAGGIGITPFASILDYFRINVKRRSKIKRIHFIWICKEVEIFTCFAKLLSDVFQIVWDTNYPDKFEFYLYLTKEQPLSYIENVLNDSFALLRPRILFGRPQWNILFERWAELYKKTDVGLFCCGPETLNSDVQRLSRKWNSHGCQYTFHHEVFS